MKNVWMTEQEIFERFARIVADSLHIDAATISPESNLEDLGAESLDMIEIAMEVESQFHVWLPEKNILDTANEVFGPGVLEQDGYLTPLGKNLLERRIAEEDSGAFSSIVAVKDLKRYFMTVRVWVRMIDGQLQYTPRVCSACGGEMTASLGFRLKCAGCGAEVTLRSGDELNREWVQEFSRNQYRYEAEAEAANAKAAEQV